MRLRQDRPDVERGEERVAGAVEGVLHVSRHRLRGRRQVLHAGGIHVLPVLRDAEAHVRARGQAGAPHVADQLLLPHAVADAKGSSVQDLTAVILDRDRHVEHIREVREAGARIRLIPDGDVAGAISTCWPDAGADILIGIGGTPEGVITAAALKCMGGQQLGRLWPRNERERTQALEQGYDLEKVLTQDELVRSDDCFFAATGITDGDLMKGVHFDARGATTESLVMRSRTGTVRQVVARHSHAKASEILNT